jgi:hypothetical protein
MVEGAVVRVRPAASDRRALGFVLLVTAALAIGIFGFYFLVYRVRHYTVPVGFDASWYVWRANFVADQGIGPLGTAIRPGHALLSATLGSVTGLSQLQLAVILPLLIVSLFALAVGAFWWIGLDPDGYGWIVAAAVAGTIVGATRLVGENVANLLHLALTVAALVALANRVAGRRGYVGSILLLVAAGLAHWMFLAVFGAVLLVAFLLALPSSVRSVRTGVRIARTEAGVLAGVGMSVATLMALVIAPVLRAPFKTFEIREDPRRFIPKLRTDVSKLFLPALLPAAAGGAAMIALATRDDGAERERRARRGVAIRILLAWTAVSALGLGWGILTLDLPPHRFLTLLVAVPGAVALTAAVVFGTKWIRRRAGFAAAAGVAAIAAMALAIPGAARWYGGGPGLWLDPGALEQARTAGRYVEQLAPETPVIFLVGPFGPAGLISVPLKERTIRVGLPPERQRDAHFYVGAPADLLAGRRSLVPDERTNRATLPYWEDVRHVLPRRTPVLVLRALAPEEFLQAVGEIGARSIGPGVALLRGLEPPAELAVEPPAKMVPRTRPGFVWGFVILALLIGAGAGWTRILLGPGVAPQVIWCSAPTMGAAFLMLGGLLATKMGVRLAGPGGIALYVAVAAGGLAVALWDSRRVHRIA